METAYRDLYKSSWKPINNHDMACAEEVLLLFLAWKAKVKGSRSGDINKILVGLLGFLCLSSFLLPFWDVGSWPAKDTGGVKEP